MALPPKFSGQLLTLTSSSPSTTSTPHTLEFYLDYVCPFSAKQFLNFTSTIVPLIKESYSTPGFRIIFRQQIQPWHPSSTLVHEAGAVVLRLAPEKFWTFSEALFKKQTEYFDANVVNEGRNQTYKRLADLIESSTGVKASEAYDLLVVSDKPGEDGELNSGNKVTNDVKFMVKANRMTGVHVTPSVVFNGVLEGSISSSWGEKEWKEWLDKNAK